MNKQKHCILSLAELYSRFETKSALISLLIVYEYNIPRFLLKY